MISKTVTVQHDEQGEAFITLDDEILEAAGLKEGDTVVWEQIDENSWALKKKE
jgi:hypothetical protein